MSIPQLSQMEPQGVLTPFSIESIGSSLANSASSPATTTSVAWPSANLVLYVPFIITVAATVQQMFVVNGATANGTVHVGIYTEDGVRVVSASATQTGTSSVQLIDVTDFPLAVGTWYMAMGSTSGTGTYHRVTPGTQMIKSYGMFQQASALPLPATWTPALIGQSFIPMFGLVFGSTL